MAKSDGGEDRPSQASFGSALPLIWLQLGSRLFSFLLNQALLRMATPSAFGTAAIQFELLLNTILFLSREGVRIALLRVKKSGPSISNVSFIPFLLGCPVALTTCYLYIRFAGEETSSQPYFHSAVIFYVFAALLELLKEPMHNATMADLNTGIRLRAEGLAIVGKSAITFLVLFLDPHRDDSQQHRALLAFALGQTFYSLCVWAIYVAHYGRQYLYPKRPPKNDTFFDPVMFKLSMTMTSQSVVKHFLTEGDKLILSWFSPLQDQGGYAIALNYGSLVARILLQPLEETSRSLFSQILADKDDKSSLAIAANRLTSFLSVQIPISLILPVFGPPFIPLGIQFLLPQQYLQTSAPQVLSAWLWYIPILALNGQLEAFFASAADSGDLNKQSTWMAIFSILYTSLAIALYRLRVGDASLVYANMINLTARILYAMIFISSFFKRRGTPELLRWTALIPKALFCGVLGGSFVLLRLLYSQLSIERTIEENGKASLLKRNVVVFVLTGGFFGLVSLGILWKLSSESRRQLRSRRKAD
ncbi:Rft-1-domain-containing protein [Guyanagaster necrorhizus]|uniref:Man(5)GlcNAc(2)-PP-dolichol translocation protein RFT1 n=1 Tax=Guyanagaster necrorhizus TaxID=856835 RepID=A0A9P8ALS7_9AGAR|nr:Rft-1-domain-containing protein [Guyanagaster necrorhizus MCA 3950]KAG7440105.1 Rft-1-domain-containing protein [Guyanagaster necrorhizus MCA 3950]